MIRAISHWATVTQLGLAAAALAQLVIAFLPVADLWAVHHPGAESAALAATLRVGAWTLTMLSAAVAFAAIVAWAGRARANLAAFGIRSRRITDSVGRDPALRRRVTALVWLLRAAVAAGAVALVLAWAAGRDNAGEIGAVRGQARAGHPVDDALAGHLLGRQLVLNLPAAALFVLAAALALLLIARVTSAQYGRVASLRAQEAAAPAIGGTIGA
ncbi:hypothetical protein [Dactylosporangium sp. CA-233914]|uniref:hypothetical protein n=1 Tax=Dactylosporangium sp. CA-233914 TaxID=3239934 RepID=UPI003D914100